MNEIDAKLMILKFNRRSWTAVSLHIKIAIKLKSIFIFIGFSLLKRIFFFYFSLLNNRVKKCSMSTNLYIFHKYNRVDADVFVVAAFFVPNVVLSILSSLLKLCTWKTIKCSSVSRLKKKEIIFDCRFLLCLSTEPRKNKQQM